jgi:hypothetical protein
MDEVRADGDDDDESGYSEDDHGEDEDGAVSHSKPRQSHSFYFTTGVVKRMESKEDGTLNVRIRTLKVLPGEVKNPPDFMRIVHLHDLIPCPILPTTNAN